VFTSCPRATPPAGFIKPCQPTLSDKAPSGTEWLHEIKHDGFVCKSGDQVRLWSRNGRDWSREFSAVTEALAALNVDDIALDGEAMAHCRDGLPDFHGLRSEEGGAAACLFAFDLLRLNGEDLRPLPLEERRATLRKALRGADKALRFSDHLEGDGNAIFRHACSLGLEALSRSGGTPAGQGAASRG
jgi:bifunctional non-homologous end joining protein LigD